MNHQLAKQLRDAGFPQRVLSGGYFTDAQDKDPIHAPDLSELIEACGYDEQGRSRMGNLYWTEAILGATEHFNGWACNGGMSYGATPEEAVAKLWLKLHGPI